MTNSLSNLAFEVADLQQVPEIHTKAGEDSVGALTLRYGDLEMDSITHTCRLAGRPCPLTRLEYQLLAFLLFNKGRVWGRTELIEQAWQKEQSSQHAIAVYINSLRRKLGRGIVRTVHGVGYTVDAEYSVRPPKERTLTATASGRRRRLFADRPMPALAPGLAQHQGGIQS